MKAFWMAIAVICLVAAAVALWQWQLNATFVLATIGVVAWFLRYRGDLKRSMPDEDEETRDEDTESDLSDEDA
jgi:membrane protein implicated in regulation of membrane protease activity